MSTKKFGHAQVTFATVVMETNAPQLLSCRSRWARPVNHAIAWCITPLQSQFLKSFVLLKLHIVSDILAKIQLSSLRSNEYTAPCTCVHQFQSALYNHVTRKWVYLLAQYLKWKVNHSKSQNFLSQNVTDIVLFMHQRHNEQNFSNFACGATTSCFRAGVDITKKRKKSCSVPGVQQRKISLSNPM